MAENVAVFMDYQNVHLTGAGVFEAYGHPLYRSVPDPAKLADLIVGRRKRDSVVAAVRVYRGRPDPNHEPKITAAFDAQAAEWTRDRRVHMVARQLNYRNWPNERPREKGIDVRLAIDLLHIALRKQYDALVLFSGDTDLMPAVESIIQLRLSHFEVACWSGAKALRLPGSNLPYCHYLSAADWDSVIVDWDGRV